MRIGIQIRHLDPRRGGTEIYVHQFARELIRRGHAVHIFAHDWREEPPGAVMHHIMVRGPTRWHRFENFGRACVKAAVEASLDVVLDTGRSYGASVLQPHGGTTLGSARQNLMLIRSSALRFLKIAFDRLNPKKITSRRMEAHQYAAPVPQVIALSRMVRDDMVRYYNVPADHLHVIYNGVDTAHFSPAGIYELRGEARRSLDMPDDATVFCLIAHNFKLKGVREFIEAAALVRKEREDFRLLIVGRGSKGRYHRLARGLGCERQLVFPGPVDDVRPMYAACDVYVQPTWYDPCSLVVLEALACGRPVITTRFNGTSELMTDGLEGFVIDTPRDTEALAERMLRLFDADLRLKMGAEARRLAEQHTLERNFEEIMTVFEKAVRLKEEEEK